MSHCTSYKNTNPIAFTSIVLGLRWKSQRRIYKTPNISADNYVRCKFDGRTDIFQFYSLTFLSYLYDPSSVSFTLGPSFWWSSAAPSLSECNLALGGSCRLNCDPLMTLQLYPSAYTYPQLKMLVIVKDRKKQPFVPRVHIPHGMVPILLTIP